MLNFIGFPRGVRDVMYEEALCGDGNLVPYPETYQCEGDYEGDPPTVALLAVNKQINKRKGETDFQYHQTLIESKSLFSRYGPLFRNLTVCYDFREGDNRADCLSELHDSWYPSNTRARMDLIHDLSMRHLSDAWDSKCRELNGMVNLTCLVIDVENLYCGIGCCRPVGSLFLAHLHLTEIEEAYIRVKGAKEDDEEKMVEDWRNKRAALRVETQGGDRQ